MSLKRLQSFLEGVAASCRQDDRDVPSIELGQGLSMPLRSAVESYGTETLQDPQPMQQGMSLRAPVDRWACLPATISVISTHCS